MGRLSTTIGAAGAKTTTAVFLLGLLSVILDLTSKLLGFKTAINIV